MRDIGSYKGYVGDDLLGATKHPFRDLKYGPYPYLANPIASSFCA